MGASIFYRTPRGRCVYLSPGWSSAMHQIAEDNYLMGYLDISRIPDIKEAAKNQRKGDERPPFDWSDSIEEAFYELVAGIRKYGTVEFCVEY